MDTNLHTGELPAAGASKFLGWFSLGLGSLEVLAPEWTARQIGFSRPRPGAVRLCGAREIASGIRILQSPHSVDGLWSRVAGDAIDIALLAKGFGDPRANRSRLTASAAAVAGVTAIDLYCAWSMTNGHKNMKRKPVRESVGIQESAEELYQFWRSFDNLPKVMRYLESVEIIDERRSHWRARPIGDVILEWDAEIVEEEPNRKISWRSLPGSDVTTSGTVTFLQLSSGGHGTAITVEMLFDLTGTAGKVLRPFLDTVTDKALKRDLRRFKQVIETGEIPTTKGQPAGRRSGETWLDTVVRA